MDRDIFLQSQSDYCPFPYEEKLHHSHHHQLFQTRKNEKTQILPPQSSTIAESSINKEKDSRSSRDSSKKLLNSAAGKQARERKKKYVESLETSVQELQKKVLEYEAQIKKTKETLAQTLNSTKNRQNQNSITYSELQLCIDSEDPNEDKINLLLDMIKFRIGAAGHERQAKIQYFFKQLVNTLFPAIHRYLMYCSEKNLDIFHEHSIDDFFENACSHQSKDKFLPWTGDFISSLQITQIQRYKLLKLIPKYIYKKIEVKQIISNLKQVKESIKNEEQIFQNMIEEIRIHLRPIQAAQWILFSDKFKYKREISLEKQGQIELFYGSKCDPTIPKKKLKIE